MQDQAAVVRSAQPSDFPGVAELLRAFQTQHHKLDPISYRPAMGSLNAGAFAVDLRKLEQLHLVAVVGDEVAGYAHALPHATAKSPSEHETRSVQFVNRRRTLTPVRRAILTPSAGGSLPARTGAA
jgi:hypothetical protein